MYLMYTLNENGERVYTLKVTLLNSLLNSFKINYNTHYLYFRNVLRTVDQQFQPILLISHPKTNTPDNVLQLRNDLVCC